MCNEGIDQDIGSLGRLNQHRGVPEPGNARGLGWGHAILLGFTFEKYNLPAGEGKRRLENDEHVANIESLSPILESKPLAGLARSAAEAPLDSTGCLTECRPLASRSVLNKEEAARDAAADGNPVVELQPWLPFSQA
jgi:hypothetical protein